MADYDDRTPLLSSVSAATATTTTINTTSSAPVSPMSSALHKASARRASDHNGGGLIFSGVRDESVSLEWRDVDYILPQSDGSERYILQGCAGNVQPGELCCIIGPSGAGKTSLLNILAGRVRKGVSPRAMVLLDDVPLDSDVARESIAYVEQEDAITPTSTVKEALQFSAALRLPKQVTEEQRNVIVDRAIKEVSWSVSVCVCVCACV